MRQAAADCHSGSARAAGSKLSLSISLVPRPDADVWRGTGVPPHKRVRDRSVTSGVDPLDVAPGQAPCQHAHGVSFGGLQHLFGMDAIVRHRSDGDDRSLPRIEVIDLRNGDIETLTQPVL